MNCRIPRINRFLNAFCTFGVYPEVRLVQCFLFFVPAALRGQLALLCANGFRPRWRMNGIRARSRSDRMVPVTGISALSDGEASRDLTLRFPCKPELRRDYPLNLSISVSGGKETN